MNQAYIDSPLPVGLDQTISQPFIVAYMTEDASISKKDKILEIARNCNQRKRRRLL
jgi:protein-L-isoaspartate(D-aspartate) O-methyltransferase